MSQFRPSRRHFLRASGTAVAAIALPAQATSAVASAKRASKREPMLIKLAAKVRRRMTSTSAILPATV
ncbi:MAG: hypothetical protein JWQ42_2632 [Edaphobacter sp.]|jgi:hypothetical protein|nr:hypothetical protein [Edaphobacter sp.]